MGRTGVKKPSLDTRCSGENSEWLFWESKTGEKKHSWRSRVSIPVPHACKARALPFELHPQGCRHDQRGSGEIPHSGTLGRFLPTEKQKGPTWTRFEPARSIRTLCIKRKAPTACSCENLEAWTHAVQGLRKCRERIRKIWSMGVSIPLPADCEPTALPSELIPLDHIGPFEVTAVPNRCFIISARSRRCGERELKKRIENKPISYIRSTRIGRRWCR